MLIHYFGKKRLKYLEATNVSNLNALIAMKSSQGSGFNLNWSLVEGLKINFLFSVNWRKLNYYASRVDICVLLAIVLLFDVLSQVIYKYIDRYTIRK